MKKRFVYFWIVFGFLILFAFLYLPGFSRLQELRSEEERLTRELAELDRQMRGLREEKSLLENDLTYLEKVIRDELGLVKPGEMVYKLIPEKKPLPSRPPVIAPSSSAAKPRAMAKQSAAE